MPSMRQDGLACGPRKWNFCGHRDSPAEAAGLDVPVNRGGCTRGLRGWRSGYSVICADSIRGNVFMETKKAGKRDSFSGHFHSTVQNTPSPPQRFPQPMPHGSLRPYEAGPGRWGLLGMQHPGKTSLSLLPAPDRGAQRAIDLPGSGFIKTDIWTVLHVISYMDRGISPESLASYSLPRNQIPVPCGTNFPFPLL